MCFRAAEGFYKQALQLLESNCGEESPEVLKVRGQLLLYLDTVSFLITIELKTYVTYTSSLVPPVTPWKWETAIIACEVQDLSVLFVCTDNQPVYGYPPVRVPQRSTSADNRLGSQKIDLSSLLLARVARVVIFIAHFLPWHATISGAGVAELGVQEA